MIYNLGYLQKSQLVSTYDDAYTYWRRTDALQNVRYWVGQAFQCRLRPSISPIQPLCFGTGNTQPSHSSSHLSEHNCPLQLPPASTHYSQSLHSVSTAIHYSRPLQQATTASHYSQLLQPVATVCYYSQSLQLQTTASHYSLSPQPVTTANHYNCRLQPATTGPQALWCLTL